MHFPRRGQPAVLLCLLTMTRAAAAAPGSSVPAAAQSPAVTQPSAPTQPPAAARSPAADGEPESAQAATANAVVAAPDLALGQPAAPARRTTTMSQPPSETGAPVASGSPSRARRPRPTAQAGESEWYGWQTLVVDASWITLIAVGGSTDVEALGGIGALGYWLGAPIVHWSHGRVGTGFGSFGIRTGAALVTTLGVAGCAASALSSDRNSGLCALGVVGLLMIPAAITIDAAVLAYDDAPSEQTAGSAFFTPWYEPSRRAGGVMWSGAF